MSTRAMQVCRTHAAYGMANKHAFMMYRSIPTISSNAASHAEARSGRREAKPYRHQSASSSHRTTARPQRRSLKASDVSPTRRDVSDGTPLDSRKRPTGVAGTEDGGRGDVAAGGASGVRAAPRGVGVGRLSKRSRWSLSVRGVLPSLPPSSPGVAVPASGVGSGVSSPGRSADRGDGSPTAVALELLPPDPPSSRPGPSVPSVPPRLPDDAGT
mmetsp:Transcript_29262/g.66707  ORF Transcript_29262/g.66707 Transcript_29262/m.66707 type:complete len:214 (-) Transcript_29262:188-829(-)